MDPFTLALLAGGGLVLFLATRKAAPAKPSDVVVVQPPTTECPYGGDKPIDQLPSDVKNAIIAALTVESDPAELEKFAVAMDKICQPTAAKALREKAKGLKSMGIPAGFDPNVVTLPIPGLSTTPEPGSPVPPAALPGLVNITGETMGTPPNPKVGVQAWPTQQFWTGPFAPGDSPWKLAKDVTGDGRRYVELMSANPEKKTVGNPASPFTTGYSFVSFKVGERIRIPRAWNLYIDQTGNVAAGAGKVLPVDPDLPSGLPPLPSAPSLPALPGGYLPEGGLPWPGSGSI